MARPRSSRSGQSQVQAGPNQHAAPIASVAKVMTAYLVLRDHPLRPGQDGPTITLTDADVADTDRRRGQRESVVSIAAGEQLTELQALQALLLPSANNIAAVLARWDAGSADAVRCPDECHRTVAGHDPHPLHRPERLRRRNRVDCRRPGASLSIGPCACRCSRASSPHRARRCRSPAPCTTPTHCSGTTGSSASRPARTTRPAAASPSGRSAGSTASGRRSPGSCWASPATTRSRRVSRPPTPWSTASPVIHGAKYRLGRSYGNELRHQELRPPGHRGWVTRSP